MLGGTRSFRTYRHGGNNVKLQICFSGSATIVRPQMRLHEAPSSIDGWVEAGNSMWEHQIAGYYLLPQIFIEEVILFSLLLLLLCLSLTNFCTSDSFLLNIRRTHPSAKTARVETFEIDSDVQRIFPPGK